jgi:hypothetical protein
MRCHTLDGVGKLVEGFHVPNGTEETGHDIELASKVKVRHICLVQRDMRVPLASNGKQPFVNIQPFHLELLLEIKEVEPGPTGNIQEPVLWGTTIPMNESGELCQFSTIIFHRLVDGVVPLGCVEKHHPSLLA